jgi:hypothetical protein
MTILLLKYPAIRWINIRIWHGWTTPQNLDLGASLARHKLDRCSSHFRGLHGSDVLRVAYVRIFDRVIFAFEFMLMELVS